ncbi:STAS/SEC14 domain-containing protein [Paraburkholderia sp. BL10I2N1]|uniref:STAS/SEC14 domain-containing protein n=1 Tax=Paraburkholderia sp. BL10I2N1 TaxID=1938796 RepID=UPI00105ECBE5|nr:STAS/SEC14 domain-containing protein [Paraburkholderia sp. BL10I2N1]TDN63268.1 SpoIIAA-like protein [Paraburkholderia sp. BL10I2N1]
MIELIPNLPENVVGITASGQVTGSDYETVLVPAIEAVLKKRSKVRLLYQVGPNYSGFTSGAMWDDMKLGVTHIGAWERVALVTDVEWIATATRMLGFVLFCPVRVFANSELAEAKNWIAAD